MICAAYALFRTILFPNCAESLHQESYHEAIGYQENQRIALAINVDNGESRDKDDAPGSTYHLSKLHPNAIAATIRCTNLDLAGASCLSLRSLSLTLEGTAHDEIEQFKWQLHSNVHAFPCLEQLLIQIDIWDCSVGLQYWTVYWDGLQHA